MGRIEVAMEKALKERQAREQGGAAEGAPETTVAPHPHTASMTPPTPRPAGTHTPPPVSAEAAFSPRNPFLVNLLDPRSAAAEEYRKLKSALVKMTEGEELRNTIMVTSSVPNEGKSLTALNLAVSLAQELDHTVLLIDADLRRPSLHRYLEMEGGVGLADVLYGEAQLKDCIIPTGIGKLSVVRAGRQVDNPVELFTSQRMKLLLEEMKHRYRDRYVIFDTTPVLPFAESRALAHLMDGVLFVVMERLVSQSNLKEALDSIKGQNLLGLVYNAASMVASDDRYSYYKSYGAHK